VYSNFSSKEDFLFEVALRSTQRLDIGDQVFEADSLRGMLEKTAVALVKSAGHRKDVIVAFEFLTTALRDTKLRRVFTQDAPAAAESPSDAVVDAWVEAHEHEFPMPREQFFEVLNALAWGLLLRRLLHGEDALPDTLITWAFTRFVPGADSSV
jgi:hypothetical protein